MKELWKPVQGFEDYEVSSLGRVRRVVDSRNHTYKAGRVLKGTTTTQEYSQVCLSKNRKSFSKRVNILVAQAFIPNPLNLPEVNHIDTKKWNNGVGNLEWCTRKGNAEHAAAMGLIARGSKHARAVLNTKQVKKIKQALAIGGSSTNLGNKYGVDKTTIHSIKTGQNWGWVA
jgi:hypothetical protein